MFIYRNLFSVPSLLKIEDKIITSLKYTLSARQKKITCIVLAIFAFISASCLMHYFFCRGKKSTPKIIIKSRHSPSQISEIKFPSLLDQKINSNKQQNETEARVVEKSRLKRSSSTLENEKRKNEKIEEEDLEGFGFIDEKGFSDFFEDEEVETCVKSKIGKGKLIELDGKLVSMRTFKCMQKLKKELEPLRKTYGNAIDNGDCFWDAFAQGLSKVLGKKFTIKELRQNVSDEIEKMDKGPEQENWVKKSMQADVMDTYQAYRDNVAFTCEELLEKNSSAIVWGQEARDGLILCHRYQVNLTVYSSGCLEDDPSKMEDDENFYYEQREILKDKPYTQTIEIGLYPGHFIPIFNK